ncbi:AraC family transcriptional regulator [Aggregatilinea lenta]|uniref:AraC family transcriptional regulator n=1 Tax=Aggregatilinea lenta TaxID=913108 RepID=UPI0013C2C9F7|nr:helix-turn-helix domain-containing protein [Aggregatilinea lenta]
MRQTVQNKAKGLLTGEQAFRLARYAPAPDLAFFIEHFWVVDWDLRGRPSFLQENLPYPSVHIVIEPDRSGIFGVMTGKFTRRLEGKSGAFGIKFRPGAFYPFVRSSVSVLTDRVLPLDAVFGDAGRSFEAAMLALEGDDPRIEQAETFLRERLPAQDNAIAEVNRIIECIVADRAITKVDHVVVRLDLSKRGLQRLFHDYVGASPKWVIKRCRLHEAAEQAAGRQQVNWARLAQDLGYFDQAHFIKDFKAMVGKTPADYASAHESA